MNILIDTSVWSLAFRKHTKDEKNQRIIEELKEIIRDVRVVMAGPVRQEVLSGIRDSKIFEELRDKLSIYKNIEIRHEDYEEAARFYNICRNHGIQGSHIDYLLCSIAVKNELLIFTLDKDFENYQKHLPIHLYEL
ncbi:MAG: PIN domain nuclease [Firmicutes bacterium HGW-Firmicutes-13]|nr:MAG: PIN domain nuclease [Firmicutes bacterium HGW-Firmicutes-13]